MVLELALTTGARVGELFAIRWENLSPDGTMVTIVEQLQPVTSQEATSLKSKKARRSSPVLETWAPFHDRGAEGRILGGTSGRARSVAFTLIKREAGLDEPGVGYHSLRHTYSRILLLERGATLLQLSAALGHAHYGTTERFYLHMCRDHMTESLRALVAPGVGVDPNPGTPEPYRRLRLASTERLNRYSVEGSVSQAR